MPPQASANEAQCVLASQILSVEHTNPDSLVIVPVNFNKGNLKKLKLKNSQNTDNSSNALPEKGTDRKSVV